MTIGHNGGPPLKNFAPKAKLGRILDTLNREDLTATQKCVGIALIATSDNEGMSSLGRADLARMASAKDKTTIFAATEKLEGDLVTKTKTPGKPNTYRVLPATVVADIIEAYEDLKTGRAESARSAPQDQCDETPLVGLKLGGSGQPAGLELGGFDPTSEVEPTQSDASATIAYIESPSEIVISKKEDRKGGVEGNLHSASEEPKRAKARLKPTAEQFDRFWTAYPLRKGKHKAHERFMALSPDHAEQAIQGAIAFSRECTNSGTDPKFIKWPQGWLSERRYVDLAEPQIDNIEDLIGPNGKRWGWWRGMEEKLRALSVDYWRQGIESAKPNGTWPWWLLTAPPGHEECLMPMELQTPFIPIYRGQIAHV